MKCFEFFTVGCLFCTLSCALISNAYAQGQIIIKNDDGTQSEISIPDTPVKPEPATRPGQGETNIQVIKTQEKIGDTRDREPFLNLPSFLKPKTNQPVIDKPHVSKPELESPVVEKPVKIPSSEVMLERGIVVPPTRPVIEVESESKRSIASEDNGDMQNVSPSQKDSAPTKNLENHQKAHKSKPKGPGRVAQKPPVPHNFTLASQTVSGSVTQPLPNGAAGEKQAKRIALQYAPPSRDIKVLEREYEGQQIYVVRFKTMDGLFDVLINRQTGAVVTTNKY